MSSSISAAPKRWLRRDELLPRESFRQGERVRAYIYDVRQEPRGPQIFLSRTHPQFMAKLFAQEVPEIYDNIIEIKAVARDPGSRAKIAVISRDSGIDPVGACVGMRGSRVQAVVGELQGEKIDIVPWSVDPATFVVNALAPAEVAKVVMDEEQRRVEVVVPDDQLSLAIGRRGQNVRLASQLTGWDIDILTEAEESERRTEEFRSRSRMFIDALDIDEVIAQSAGDRGLHLARGSRLCGGERPRRDRRVRSPKSRAELQERARNALERRDQEYQERRIELGVADDLAALDGLTPGMLVALGEKGVKTPRRFRRSGRRRAGRTARRLGQGRRYPRSRNRQRADHGGPRPLVRGRTHIGAGVAATAALGISSAAPGDTAEAGEGGAQRRCIVTGEVCDRARLLRFVVGPGAALVPDVAARLPGRGLWLTPRRDIVERAVGKRLFARAARRPVVVPIDLADRIEALLVQRCIDAVGLARRAGLAVGGFERVSDAARTGKAAVLLIAVDGTAGARRKMRSLARDLPLVCVLTAAEIGVAFGREHVVNASLGAGPLCGRLIADAEKIAGFRAEAAVERAAQPVPAGPARQDDGIGAR